MSHEVKGDGARLTPSVSGSAAGSASAFEVSAPQSRRRGERQTAAGGATNYGAFAEDGWSDRHCDVNLSHRFST